MKPLEKFSKTVAEMLVVLRREHYREVEPEQIAHYFIVQGFLIGLSNGLTRDEMADLTVQCIETAYGHHLRSRDDDEGVLQ